MDYTSRLCQSGKARVSGEVAGILDRLGSSAEIWEGRLKKLFAKSRLLGSHFGTDRDHLRELATNFEIAETDHRDSFLASYHRQRRQDVEDSFTEDLEALNDRVYAELFLTPKSDPWLGLVAPNTYTALPNDGVVHSQATR